MNHWNSKGLCPLRLSVPHQNSCEQTASRQCFRHYRGISVVQIFFVACTKKLQRWEGLSRSTFLFGCDRIHVAEKRELPDVHAFTAVDVSSNMETVNKPDGVLKKFRLQKSKSSVACVPRDLL